MTQNEAFSMVLLGTKPFEWSNNVSIAPNPVDDVLNIQSSTPIQSVTLTDVTGKIVLKENASANIAVGHLQKGMYFATIQTDSGSTVKKFIKK